MSENILMKGCRILGKKEMNYKLCQICSICPSRSNSLNFPKLFCALKDWLIFITPVRFQNLWLLASNWANMPETQRKGGGWARAVYFSSCPWLVASFSRQLLWGLLSNITFSFSWFRQLSCCSLMPTTLPSLMAVVLHFRTIFFLSLYSSLCNYVLCKYLPFDRFQFLLFHLFPVGSLIEQQLLQEVAPR